jgi:uncharacterized OB-fold protein
MKRTAIKMFFSFLFLILAAFFYYMDTRLLYEFLAVFLAGILLGGALSDFEWRCPACRSLVFPTSRFCGRCGKELK